MKIVNTVVKFNIEQYINLFFQLQVIIKSLHRDCVHSEIQDFLKSAGLLQDLEHEHIVRLYGVINDTDNENLMLVSSQDY